MFLKVMIITLILLAIGVFAMMIQVFFSRKKKFIETHVSKNVHLREKGISCSKCENMGSCPTPVTSHE